ncbi:MAG: Calx-beta domain-containing protein, partial [Catalinimonas sp.]
GTGSTAEQTLVRMASVGSGTTDWSVGSTQWSVFPQNDSSFIGGHTSTACEAASDDPIFAFAITSQDVTEDVGTVTVEIELINSSADSAVSVEVAYRAGTATPGENEDFTFTDETVTFPANSTANQTVTIIINDDDDDEGDETITLVLRTPEMGYMLNVDSTFTLTILQSDQTGPPYYTIGTIRGDNTGGFADSLGVEVTTTGVVYGPNFRPAGLEFAISDETGSIGVFDANNSVGYTFMEGDSIRIQGTVSMFRGLSQINPTSIEVLATGIDIGAPAMVSTLDESTESAFVMLEGVFGLVDTAQWRGNGSSFNVDITNGVDTFLVRVDSDVDLANEPAPMGAFRIRGIGGQFDGRDTSQFDLDQGYQLRPRGVEDLMEIPYYDIGTIRGDNTGGVADSVGVEVTTAGVVYGPNFRPSGLEFAISDETGSIGVFDLNNGVDYEFMEGDSIRIAGTVTVFNGLSQINPDLIQVLATGVDIGAPDTVSTLDESTESDFVILEGAYFLATPEQWEGDGGSFNVDVTNGVDTFLVRVDGDVDLADEPAPTGTFRVQGIGGQFDNRDTSMFDLDRGYQLRPRGVEDLIILSVPEIPYYDIATLRGDNTNGAADSIGLEVQTTGIVYEPNFRPAGLEFAISDATGSIGVFSLNDDRGYTVTDGDSIRVFGTVGQFNGLSQIVADSIQVIAAGLDIGAPDTVSTLDESTESDFVILEGAYFLATPEQWTGDGGSFNVDVTNGVDTFLVRIDSDVELSDDPAPTGPFRVQGIGGQFNGNLGFFEGYQLRPRGAGDIITVVSARDLARTGLKLFPNPADQALQLQLEGWSGTATLRVVDALGRRVMTREVRNGTITLPAAAWPTGIYLIEVHDADRRAVRRVSVVH